MIVLLHAYSRGNSGDGLLVDLALEVIRDAVPEDDDVRVVALDPDSFSDLKSVVPAPIATTTGSIRRAVTAVELAFSLAGSRAFRASAELTRLLDEADLIVGVGGGYMRAGTLREGSKACLAHAVQARAASLARAPSVYLPQSAGPFRGTTGQILRDSLQGIDAIFLRDDRSLQELGGSKGARRAPDMAVMKLASSFSPDERANQFDKVYLIARHLEKPAAAREQYIDRLRTLRRLLPHSEIVVQSNTRGNNDVAFYKTLGWGENLRSLRQAISESGVGVVISVRLHGALQALISGCPAVHLSYERKGFGAFEDLGIGEFVHQATTYDPEAVASQVTDLIANARTFWNSIGSAVGRTRMAEAEVKTTIQQLYRSQRGAKCAA